MASLGWAGLLSVNGYEAGPAGRGQPGLLLRRVKLVNLQPEHCSNQSTKQGWNESSGKKKLNSFKNYEMMRGASAIFMFAVVEAVAAVTAAAFYADRRFFWRCFC